MKPYLKFYGASDDLIEVEGNLDGCDEYYEIKGRGTFEVSHSSEETGLYRALLVTVEYGPRGTWSVGVAPAEEEVAMPDDWNIKLGQDHDYSAMLTMNPPEGATVTRVD